jgi:hypothetical protein
MPLDTQSDYVSTSNVDMPFEGNNHVLCSTTIHNNDQAEQIDNASSSNLDCDISWRSDYDFEEIKVADFFSFFLLQQQVVRLVLFATLLLHTIKGTNVLFIVFKNWK